MLIENAERFGLSQLHHQVVGRGAAQSYCLLMSSSKTETAQSRLKVLEQSQDGFSSRRWICAFAVLEKCWVVVNLGYRTSWRVWWKTKRFWRRGGSPEGDC